MLPSWVLKMKTIQRPLTALERLKDDEAFAPSLLGFELRNLLLANERPQRILPAQMAAALNLVKQLPLSLDGQADSGATLQLARAHSSDLRVCLTDSAQID
jgi:hypothetical protein